MSARLPIPQPRRELRWLPRVLLLSLVAWLAMRESGRLDVGDVYWHLRTGDLVLDDGLPRSDPFSWTAGGETWQPNAWLGDVVWAAVRAGFGEAGVSLLAGITVLAVAFLLYRACFRNGAGQWAAAGVSATAVIFMSPFIAPRPLLLGFVLFPVTIAAAKNFRGGSARSLATIAVLVAAWSNLHGSFVTGVATIGLLAVGWAIDERHWLRPATLAVTALVAGLLNPFGISAYLHTLDVRDESVNIDEWQPLAFDDARGILLFAFMVLTAWALWRLAGDEKWAQAIYGRTRRWEELLPIAALAVGTFAVIRTGAFFLLIAAPTAAAGVSRLKAARIRAWAAPRRGPLTTGLLVAGIILAVQQIPTLSETGDPGPRFSETVAAAIPTACPLLNEYDVGGFIIDRRWPEVLVSQDGRNDLYGAAEIERQERLFESTDVDAFEATGVRCVVADRDRPLAAALSADPDWDTRSESSGLVLLVNE